MVLATGTGRRIASTVGEVGRRSLGVRLEFLDRFDIVGLGCVRSLQGLRVGALVDDREDDQFRADARRVSAGVPQQLLSRFRVSSND